MRQLSTGYAVLRLLTVLIFLNVLLKVYCLNNMMCKITDPHYEQTNILLDQLQKHFLVIYTVYGYLSRKVSFWLFKIQKGRTFNFSFMYNNIAIRSHS